MALKVYRPTSPGRRGMTGATFEEITKKKPEKSLLLPLKKKAGRNQQGRITVRHRGGDVSGRLRARRAGAVVAPVRQLAGTVHEGEL